MYQRSQTTILNLNGTYFGGYDDIRLRSQTTSNLSSEVISVIQQQLGFRRCPNFSRGDLRRSKRIGSCSDGRVHVV
ncbi:SEC14 cytosolic factor family protein / phosphoglyceride transfer family protein [Zea mays]|uniref:SEC14 cytosolic factor family protein / phosphoglyceride transfer family protein n=1 Tax=Zea mays TaxID=4577 RepID=A0A1D6M9Q2_MAIZE|nr:SEC14 cytosolic factor family protein / phosphoglyceride transfer family protein [Zea mays]